MTSSYVISQRLCNHPVSAASMSNSDVRRSPGSEEVNSKRAFLKCETVKKIANHPTGQFFKQNLGQVSHQNGTS